jgi:SET domain-containing protein
MVKRKKNKHEFMFPDPVPSYYHTSLFTLEIKDSTIKDSGQGVFTLEDIQKDTLIDHYLGTYQIIPTSKYYFQIKDGFGIDAGTYPRCYMGMVNDSSNSNFRNNCTFVVDENDNTVTVHSLQDIKAGEELFISYGGSYWNL